MLDGPKFSEFGSMVFSKKLMKEKLPSPIYIRWKETVRKEGLLDRETADAIAHSMKEWALEKGCSHFTHWFQPMTGSTAEKHDSFIETDKDGLPILRFSGKSLIKGEPDASSFPSGGLRATFEARGYTYWDFTSPAFILDSVLCIPSVFVSFNGESLDKKAPLLKSMEALNTAATKLVNIFGGKDVKAVYPMVGLEQEYFLIDKEMYNKRLDLKICNRTLFGAMAPKGQELDDHYFGSIPTRVYDFMQEVDAELWKLGIFIKTEHNEVAPRQFEICPLFANSNVAVDQNQLIMATLKKVAERHDFACLLHEKPFANINGSGKHNNYSLVTNDNQNLFDPGDKPSENIRFLTFICAFIKAVDKYPVLLRMSSSSAGNDHRLGASEAPPAIISIFLGSYVESLLKSLGEKEFDVEKDDKEFNPIRGLSYIPKDNTDRNRTSPVAFTGNRFEFRMLGSSLSAAVSNTVLNTILAEAINEISVQLEDIKYRSDIRNKAVDICKLIIKDNSKVLFSGDGYSSSWLKEAEKRGLPNVTSYIDSVACLKDRKVIDLFTSNGIYSEREIESRLEINAEQYTNVIGLEIKTLSTIVKNEVEPCMMKDLAFYEKSGNNPIVAKRLAKVSKLLTELDKQMDNLNATYNSMEKNDCYKHALAIKNDVVPLLAGVRNIIDSFEEIVILENYNIPTYTEMLY
jgi:glutamine synthetase